MWRDIANIFQKYKRKGYYQFEWCRGTPCVFNVCAFWSAFPKKMIFKLFQLNRAKWRNFPARNCCTKATLWIEIMNQLTIWDSVCRVTPSYVGSAKYVYIFMFRLIVGLTLSLNQSSIFFMSIPRVRYWLCKVNMSI